MSVKHVKPPKVLKANIRDLSLDSTWDEGPTDDPLYGLPYRWVATLEITAQEHGDPQTDTSFYYDGNDIIVGDWLSATINGMALQIIEIYSKNNSQVVALVEDVERYNLMVEPVSVTSYGAGSQGPGVVFSMGDDGLPVVGPLPQYYLPDTFATDMISRFRYRNLMRSFVRVKAPGHTMQIGDVIRPDLANPGKFIKALGDANVASVIGVVSDVNTPSEDWYNFKPFGDIRENVSPALVGNYGDFFYVDPVNAGLLTNVRPHNNARPIYMRLENETRGLLLASGSGNTDTNETKRYDVVTPAGDQVNFTLPADAEEVLWMSINGIENSNFTFDPVSKGIVFNPTATGYGVDVTDEVFFIYKS